MFRATVGTLEAIVGGNAWRREIASGVPGKQVWRRKASTRSAPTTAPWHQRPNLSQTWNQQFAKAGRSARYGPRITPPKRPFHSSRSRRAKEPSGADTKSAAEAPMTLSARLRKLTREYGWAGVGVYFGLSVLDFPFCFLLVRTVGTDRIGAIEHTVVSSVSSVIPESVKSWWQEYRQAARKAEKEELGSNRISDDIDMAGWGVKEAQEKHKAEASLATQLALAYAIHKSFIFIRVPLTAAVTPKVVQVLRSWGWQIGKRAVKG